MSKNKATVDASMGVLYPFFSYVLMEHGALGILYAFGVEASVARSTLVGNAKALTSGTSNM